MTRDEFLQLATPAIRHGMTVAAGLLAAKGIATPDGTAQFATLGASVVSAAMALGWSYAEKNAVVARMVGALPMSDVDLLAQTVADFKAAGASPLLLAHMSQSLAAIATAEFQATQVPQSNAAGQPWQAGDSTQVAPPEPAPNPAPAQVAAAGQTAPVVAGPFQVVPAELQPGDGA